MYLYKQWRLCKYVGTTRKTALPKGFAMRIRIVGTPPGFAPESVRQGWVGIELESTGRENADAAQPDARLGQENLGGYQVDGAAAFQALERHNKAAYDWWIESCPEATASILIFRADVCEELPGEVLQAVDLVAEVRRHFELLAGEGCRLGEIREIAHGIIVAHDESDGTFLYYFLKGTARFQMTREAQLWGANDQAGQVRGCSHEVICLICGLNHPRNWGEVVEQALMRLERSNGEPITWHEPRPIPLP